MRTVPYILLLLLLLLSVILPDWLQLSLRSLWCFLAGSLLVADYPASISSARTPPAISIYNSDPKHTVPFPVLDTIYTAVCIQMWTLFHGFTLSVSVSAPLARFPLPINNCQSNLVVFFMQIRMTPEAQNDKKGGCGERWCWRAKTQNHPGVQNFLKAKNTRTEFSFS